MGGIIASLLFDMEFSHVRKFSFNAITRGLAKYKILQEIQ